MNKMKIAKICLYIGLSFWLCACSQKKKSLMFELNKNAMVADSFTSKILITKEGEKTITHAQVVNYINIDYPFTANKNEGILKTITTTTSELGAQKLTQTNICISPVYFRQQNKDIKNYSTTIEADHIEYRDACLFAKKSGDDENEDSYTVLNPLNGEQIMTYTNEYIDAVIPDSKTRRFVAFLSSKCNYFKATAPEKNQIGIITYASNINTINRFAILVNVDAIFKVFSLYTPNMQFTTTNNDYKVLDEGRRLGLMTLKENYLKENISDFNVEITFYYGEEAKESKMILPIHNDAIDISKITFDKNIFTIHAIKQ
jgi:hypothetical protein